jgi:hypothetical protein
VIDYVGNFPFARLESVPRPVDRQFRTVSHSGQDGITIWDLGLRADPYTFRGTAFVIDYVWARWWLEQLKTLETAAPVTITVGGIWANDRLYQVTRVTPVECKQIVMARGPTGFYRAKLVVDFTVQPIAL